MSSLNIPPFNRPVSLFAACILAVVGIGLLSVWGLPTVWVIVLIALVVIITGVGTFVVIKYPQTQLQDESLLEYEKEQFRDFTGEAAQHGFGAPESTKEIAPSDLNVERMRIYEGNRGLFLVHDWRFSERPDQVADVIIRLLEHPYTRRSLLEEGKVESVTYELGRRFSETPLTKRNGEDGFALEVSAYGPMLCIAQVHFNDGHEPILLTRYIDFPVAS